MGRTIQKSSDEISVPQAAVILGCTDRTVLNMIARGTLEAWRLDDRSWWKVSERRVRRLLDVRRRRGARKD